MFVSEISSLSRNDLTVPRLAGNYSPCSRPWTRLDARVHVQLKVGWGLGINRSAVINDRTKKTLLSRRGTLEEGVARHRAGKGVERRGCFQVELQATPLCATLGFDPFLFSPSQGDCRLKGNADTGPLNDAGET